MGQKQDPLAIATEAVDVALRTGADVADAYVRSARELDVEFHNGEVESIKRARSLGLGLRVTVDGRTALVHTTEPIGLSLLQLTRRAVEIARALPPEPDPVQRARAQAIDAFPQADPDLMAEPLETKTARLREAERAMLAVEGVSRSSGLGWSEGEEEIALANSLGQSLYAPRSWVALGIEGIAERDGESVTGGRYVTVPSRRQLPDAGELGRDAGRRAAELLGARPVPTTRAPVIFTPTTGWTLLGALTGALRGDRVADGRSYLADRVGEVIAAPAVTIRDNPLLADGVARRRFDAEGTPTRNLALVEGGKLAHYLTDLASAEKLGVTPSGNAGRGSYTQQAEIGDSNLYLEAGPETPEEIIRATPRGLLVTVLSGWWVGISPSHDTYSSAAMGHWIENGEIVHPVRGVSIGGQLLEMLAGIDRIGNDLRFLNATSTATFRVGEMAISGT